MKTYAATPRHCCPTCGSNAPHLHPAVQFEGEVETCPDDYHLIPTNQNGPAHIQAVLAKRAKASAALARQPSLLKGEE